MRNSRLGLLTSGAIRRGEGLVVEVEGLVVRSISLVVVFDSVVVVEGPVVVLLGPKTTPSSATIQEGRRGEGVLCSLALQV